MKLLHFADLHLGIENYGAINPRSGLSTRVDDFLRAFDEIIDVAMAERVDALLFAGDVFKNRDPNPTLQRLFAERIRRLSENEVPTVLLVGNHDLPAITARATAIDIYQTLEVPHIFSARRIDLLRVPTRSGPLQIVTLPWVSRGRFLTREEIRELNADELQRRMAEEISAGIEQLVAEIDSSLPSVLLGHLSIEGAKLGSEQSIMLGAELVLGRDEIQASAFDYVALGHIHRHQAISAHPPIVYPGSVERIDFGEEREEKGYVLIDIEPGPDGGRVARWEFRPLQTRPFLTIKVNSTSEDPMIDVERAIQRHAHAIEGAIVRASIAVPPEREEMVRLDEIRRQLQAAGAAWVARIVRDVEIQSRPRVDIRGDEALDPVTMLDRWLKLRELSDEQRKKVLEAGVALIRGSRAGE